MNGQFWWYVARSSGIVAAVLLALTVIWGLLLATRVIDRRGLPAWLTDLHRALGGLTLGFTGVHLTALVADSYVHLGWADLLVPFASAYRRGPLGWGVLAMWIVVAVEVSSLARRRLSRTTWWRIHALAYPAFVLVGLHAAGAGTDRTNPLFVAGALGLVTVVTFLTLVRVLSPGGRAGRRRPVAARAGAARAAEPAGAGAE